MKRISLLVFLWLLMTHNLDGLAQRNSRVSRKPAPSREAGATKAASAQEGREQTESVRTVVAEPTSQELALAFTRFIKSATPTCPNLENMEYCEWAPRVLIRLKGGEKRSCQMMNAAGDYHCAYSVEFECVFLDPKTGEPNTNPIVNAVYCSMWGKHTYRTGVRKIANQWMVYPLNRDPGKAEAPLSVTPPDEGNLRLADDGKSCLPNSSREQVYVLTNTLNNGLPVKRGERITIRASGSIRFGPFAGSGGPQGISFNPMFNYVRQFPHGALMGRIKRLDGEDRWRYIGAGFVGIAQADGILQFAINDNDSQNNTGQFRVEVTICGTR